MSYDEKAYAAIPTVYRRIKFRSRLEAKWAAFFDLLGWVWQYEPVDTIGWVPDFLITNFEEVASVEVKPIEWAGGAESCFAMAARRGDLQKVRSSQRRRKIIVGAYPPDKIKWDSSVGANDISVLGVLCGADGFSWAYVAPERRSPREGDYAFLLSDVAVGGVMWAGSALFDDLWRQACTDTQWRADGR